MSIIVNAYGDNPIQTYLFIKAGTGPAFNILFWNNYCINYMNNTI